MEFRYDALDVQGGRSAGTVEAPDEAGAAASLRARGLFATRLVPAGGSAPGEAGPGRRGWRWPGVVRSGDVAMFLSQLALMLRSGLTLLRALQTMSREAGKRRLRACAGRLAEAVQAGRPLAEALAAERLLPPVLPRMARAAEVTGELDEAFARAADHVERLAALRLQLVTSLAYPAIVVLAAIGAFVFLTTQVVPKFASLLAQRGVALPWTTQTLMDVSDFMVRYGLHLGLALLALAALAGVASRTTAGRRVLERLALAVPVVGHLIQASALAGLTRTLGLLLRSGLPLLQALQALEGTIGLRSYEDVVARARDGVTRGASLAASLRDPLVPAVSLQVVSIGEETGGLDEVIAGLADYYERRTRQLVRTLATLAEPALLVLIGGMVGFVFLSFFQVLFRVAVR